MMGSYSLQSLPIKGIEVFCIEIICAAAVCILSVFTFFFVGSVMDQESFLFCIDFVKAHVQKRNHA